MKAVFNLYKTLKPFHDLVLSNGKNNTLIYFAKAIVALWEESKIPIENTICKTLR